MAVLLSNIMDRMDRLEKKVDSVLLNGTSSASDRHSKIMEAIAQADLPGDLQIKVLPPQSEEKPVGVKGV